MTEGTRGRFELDDTTPSDPPPMRPRDPMPPRAREEESPERDARLRGYIASVDRRSRDNEKLLRGDPTSTTDLGLVGMVHDIRQDMADQGEKIDALGGIVQGAAERNERLMLAASQRFDAAIAAHNVKSIQAVVQGSIEGAIAGAVAAAVAANQPKKPPKLKTLWNGILAVTVWVASLALTARILSVWK